MSQVHMIQQIIKYSDGTETVIDYRGVIENGVLMPDHEEDAHFASESAAEEVAPEVVAEEVAPEEVAPEVAEEAAPEAPAEEAAPSDSAE